VGHVEAGLRSFDLRIPQEHNRRLTDHPLGYFDFLTDSGGIQEEATAPPIRKKVLVMRLSTERPEAVKTGFVKVVGTEKRKILKAIEETLADNKKLSKTSPYRNGKTAEKINEILKKEFILIRLILLQ